MGKRLSVICVAATGVMALGAQTGAQTPAPTPPPPTCQRPRGDDRGYGGHGPAQRHAWSGRDRGRRRRQGSVSGQGGNDTLCGEAGLDKLNGDEGNDTLNGGKGNDALNGGKGKDKLNAGKGKDKCIGGGISRPDTVGAWEVDSRLSIGIGSA